MSFELIFSIILKILGCAIVIYLLASFLVSLTKLLPILAIASSVACIFAISYVREANDEALIWIPIVLSILMLLFYNGKGFMNPRIQENLYRVVSVERKWKSLYKDFDEYEVHFSPVAIGGFFENALFSGILFWLYYEFTLMRPELSLAYIFPFFIIGMSIFDFLMAWRIFRPGRFLYAIIRILVFLLAIGIALINPFKMPTKTWRTEELYIACAEQIKFDYTQSYEMEFYLYDSHSSKEDHISSRERYVYDSQLNTGAQYSEKDDGTRYYSVVYAPNSNYNNAVARFDNYGNSQQNNFKYLYNTPEPKGGFMYFTVHANSDFADYYQFNRERYEKSSYLAREASFNEEYAYLSLDYKYTADENSTLANDFDYKVHWVFNTDENQNILSVRYIEVKVYLSAVIGHTYYECWTYTPIYTQTGLNDLFDNDNNLKDYVYNQNEFCATDVSEVLGSLNNYDCKITESYDNETNSYLYDSDTNMVAYYANRLDDANKVDDENISTYPPDYYVSNADYSKYNADYTLIDNADPSSFSIYTFDNDIASSAIANMLSVPFSMNTANATLSTPTDYDWDVFFLRTLSFTSYDEQLGVDVKYELSFVIDYNGLCYLHSAKASCNYMGKNYEILAYVFFDNYDIASPVVAE